MRLEELRKGLWGYRRDDVFKFITEMEDEAAKKLAEQGEAASEAENRAIRRAQELEKENRALRSEVDRLRAQQEQISMAILDARASAEALKAETRAQEEAARAAVRGTMEEELAELRRYAGKLAALREAIRSTLEDLDRDVAEAEELVEAAAAASPAANLTLFE